MQRTIRRLALLASCGAVLAGVASAPAQAATAPPITGGATNLTQTSATVYGYIPTSEVATAYAFAYGTSTSYNQVTTIEPVPSESSNGLIPVTATITGLSPGTTYDFVLASVVGEGVYSQEFLGGNKTFTTLTKSSSHPTGPSGVKKRIGRVRLVGATLAVAHKKGSVSLRCTSTQPCGGLLSIASTHKVNGRRTTTKCVSNHLFSIGAGQTVTFKPKLKSRCLKLLGKASNHKLAAKLSVAPATGQPKLTAHVVLRK